MHRPVLRLLTLVALSFLFPLLLMVVLNAADAAVPQDAPRVSATEPAAVSQQGSLDPSFGIGGFITVEVGPDDRPSAANIELQPDGKIVVAANAGGPPTRDFLVMRYLADGSPDPAFGTAGWATVDFGSDDYGYDDVGLDLQRDGKIVIAGTTTGLYAVARLKTDGSLDPTFNLDGRATFDPSIANDGAQCVVVKPDGRILVGCRYAGANASNFAAVQYEINGFVDIGFGTDGMTVVDFEGNADYADEILLQPDGKIVLAGYVRINSSTPFDVGLARLLEDGTPDSSFGVDGRVRTDFGDNEAIFAATLQADGKILAVGTDGLGDLLLARYDSDGNLDPSFDADGYLRTDLGGDDSGFGITVQEDGKIIVVGRAGEDLAVVRYHTDGGLDASFGVGGIVTDDLTGATEIGYDVALRPDGRIVVVGKVFDGLNTDILLAQYIAESSPWRTTAQTAVPYDASRIRVAFDSGDNPHLVVSTGSSADIEYAYFDGASWLTDTVATAGSLGQPGIDLDSAGTPHLAWHVASAEDVIYAYGTNPGWHIETAAGNVWPKDVNIEIDSSDRPHLNYFRDTDDTVHHIWHNGSAWQDDTVPDGVNLGDTATDFRLDDLDQPHVVYASVNLVQSYYAYKDSSWHVEPVPGSSRGPVSLDLDSESNPHFAQFNRVDDTMRYHWRDAGGWTGELVDPAATYYRHEIRLTPNDQPLVNYQVGTGQESVVRFAQRLDSDSWWIQDVGAGSAPGMAMDSAGEPHVAYYTGNALIYASIPPTSTAAAPVTATSSFSVDWQAGDPGPSAGLGETCLWAKLEISGTWASTGQCQAGTGGTFDYQPDLGNGVYFLQTVAVDNAGNQESAPSGFGDAVTIVSINDITAPESWVTNAPTYLPATGGQLSWVASDPDPSSGLTRTCLWTSYDAGLWIETGLCSPGWSGTYSFVPAADGSYCFRTIAEDRAGLQEDGGTPTGAPDDCSIADIQAPTTMISSPLTVSGTQWIVTWSGDDPLPGSGVVAYDLEYRVGAESWQAWHTEVTSTSTAFGPQEPVVVSANQDYAFRARAHDLAGNVGSFGQVVTTTTGHGKVFLPAIMNRTSADPYEENDHWLDAYGPLQSGVSYQALPDDVDDYFYLLLPTTATLTISVTSYAPTSDNGQLLLYGPVAADEQGNLIDYFSIPGHDAMVVGPVELGAGRYYIRVYTSGAYSDTESYTLQVLN